MNSRFFWMQRPRVWLGDADVRIWGHLAAASVWQSGRLLRGGDLGVDPSEVRTNQPCKNLDEEDFE